MLLTLKPPTQSPGFQTPHVYPSPRLNTSTYSPPESKTGPLIHHLAEANDRAMTTQHRGLPPPMGMALPNPMSDRGPPQPPSQHPPTMSQNPPMGQLPAPPSSQWPGSGDAMREWLAAKAEEDKRKQEEERTRQESLRLEQRRIEQSMLRESLQGGIPPHLVPIVFAGMGGGSLATAGLEWAQQHISQMTAQMTAQNISSQQQQQLQQPQIPPPPPQSHHASPDVRRERAFTGGPQPNPYASHQPPQPRSYPFDGSRPGQAPMQSGLISVPRSSASSLSRLNTGEMSIHQPPPPGSALPTQSSHPHSQAEHTAQSTPTTNSIYFHHWVPPSNSKEAGSPSDFINSPKKRKPNASGKTPETSPSFSHPASASRRGRAMSIQKGEVSSESFIRSEALGMDSRPGSQHGKYPVTTMRHGSVQPHENISPPSSGNSGGKGRKRVSSGSPPRRDGSLS